MNSAADFISDQQTAKLYGNTGKIIYQTKERKSWDMLKREPWEIVKRGH